jgi:hypothetical protein
MKEMCGSNFLAYITGIEYLNTTPPSDQKIFGAVALYSDSEYDFNHLKAPQKGNFVINSLTFKIIPIKSFAE